MRRRRTIGGSPPAIPGQCGVGTDQKANVRSADLVEAEFDKTFYAERYGGLGDRTDPVDHFLTIGWIQGRDPSPQFSIFNYLLRNDDVLFRHLNPFVHYLVSGRQEGRLSYAHVDDDKLYLPWDSEVAELLPMWFDEDYYLRLNPELEGSPNLLSQFLVLGWVEGRDPCERFSTHKYMWKYSDVWASGINPLIHYLRSGQAEGREIAPAEGSRCKISRRRSDTEWLEQVKSEFDPDFYKRKTYPSCTRADGPFWPLQHNRLAGRPRPQCKILRPQVSVATSRCSEFRAGAVLSFCPIWHFRRPGRHSNLMPCRNLIRRTSPKRRTNEDLGLRAEFDEQYYLSTYPELAVVEDCFQHYMTIGWKEGRNPSRDFDTSFYLRNEGDIRQAEINPFRHYILHGRREGRRGIHRLPRLADQTIFPKLSIIVPNFNHARFLPERLRRTSLTRNIPTAS